jgi:hypothetical protein
MTKSKDPYAPAQLAEIKPTTQDIPASAWGKERPHNSAGLTSKQGPSKPLTGDGTAVRPDLFRGERKGS